MQRHYSTEPEISRVLIAATFSAVSFCRNFLQTDKGESLFRNTGRAFIIFASHQNRSIAGKRREALQSHLRALPRECRAEAEGDHDTPNHRSHYRLVRAHRNPDYRS